MQEHLGNLNENFTDSENEESEDQSRQIREKETTASSRRYPERERRKPVRFMINALNRVRDPDEPTVKEALNSDVREKWNQAIETEVKTLNGMKC